MARKTTHIVPNGNNGWKVVQGGAERASAILPTKAAAFERGRDIARNLGSELLTHNRNGQIASSNSYGHDPYPPRG